MSGETLMAGPDSLIECALPDGEIHQVRVEYIGLTNGLPVIVGWDESGTSRVVEPGWVLRILEEYVK